MRDDKGWDKGNDVASQIRVDTSTFDGNLSSTDRNVQEALETLDDLTINSRSNIDGGRAVSVYTLPQNIDGGNS